MLTDTVQEILQGTTSTVVMRTWNRGWDEAVPEREWPLAQISEILDAHTCDLCRHVDGMIIKRGTPEFAKWSRPSHINCRRVLAYVSRDEVGPDGKPTEPDFTEPPSELVTKHGHFIAEPLKYEPLRVPARPTGRDFVAYRPAGQAHVNLRWRDALPNTALRETLRTMASGFRDLAALAVPGDAELALQIMDHAAARSIWTNAPDAYRRHGADWEATAGALTEDEYRSIPARTLSAPDAGLGTHTDEDGRVTWFAHSPRVALGERELDDVVVTYRPDRAGYERAFRLPAEAEGNGI